MSRTKTLLGAAVAAAALTLSGAGVALAEPPPDSPRFENCGEVIAKQNAKGQTGSETGSANDEKQLLTAVTNCDQFWNKGGAGSNP